MPHPTPRCCSAGHATRFVVLERGDVTVCEAASVMFPVIDDGEVHEYVSDPRTGRGWPFGGDLDCVRFEIRARS